MSLSIIGQSALAFGAVQLLDPRLASAEREPRSAGFRPWKKTTRRHFGLRGATHSLLTDARGVWAWSPVDPHAAAVRHAGVPQWMEANPGRDIHMWVAADLAHRAERLDLQMFRDDGVRHGVRMQSIAAWWYHAFLEAKRCVNALNHVARAQVCVVEGRQITWILVRYGELVEVYPTTLSDATVGALQATIDRFDDAPITVALGQGLVDGDRTRDLGARVLGRLDGEHPPQWLRPSPGLEIN